MARQKLALWLQPDPDAAVELDAQIARLATVHDTATFSSHLTVLGPLDEDPDGAAAPLAELAAGTGPLLLRFNATRCEAAWHRSLYLVAVPDPALRRLADRAARSFAVSRPAVFEPHLSLQYSQLPVADKVRLAARVDLTLPLAVRFDRLSLWQVAGSDPGRWRLVAQRALAAG